VTEASPERPGIPFPRQGIHNVKQQPQHVFLIQAFTQNPEEEGERSLPKAAPSENVPVAGESNKSKKKKKKKGIK